MRFEIEMRKNENNTLGVPDENSPDALVGR
jgi:hypothetical protein